MPVTDQSGIPQRDGRDTHRTDLMAGLIERAGAWGATGEHDSALDSAASFLMSELGASRVSFGMTIDGELRVREWPEAFGSMSETGKILTQAISGQRIVSATTPDGGGVVAIPLRLDKSVIGALTLEGVDPRRMPDDDSLETAGRLLGFTFEHVRLVGEAEESLRQTVTVLAALVEERDAYTESHCIHLAEMALGVGVRLGMASKDLDRLTYGGLLHDVGKISLPDSILTKPGPLDAEETAEMQTHASIGERVLERIGFLRAVAPIVGQHHERFDGKGYPYGFKGDQILVEARILAVVDAFDAMTSTRPYRTALPWPQAYEEINAGSGTQFDPDITDVFLKYLEGEEAQWRRPNLS